MTNSHTQADLLRAVEPVQQIETDPQDRKLETGIALCLSGGGFRAMLFHLGSLWRLNELGYLPRLQRVSSVSGGSITAALLALRWLDLDFDQHGVARRLDELLVKPIRKFGGRTIDALSVIGGLLGPGGAGDRVAEAYREHLYGETTLQDLPDSPRFVINATNVQSGVLWRFMKPYMRDYRVGEVKKPQVELAFAVAASSAFPPVLSPVSLKLDAQDFTPGSGTNLQREPFTTDVVLSDGGVYDNLGLETAWKKYDTILVSDAGGHLEPEAEPKHDWVRHTQRILFVIDNQVRALRKRQVIDSFVLGARRGTYWGIRTDISNYDLPDALPCPHAATLRLAGVATRLKGLDAETQERLINWGYASCDAAMRKHVGDGIQHPPKFPYPRGVN